MKSKEEAEALIQKAWDDSVTRNGFKNRVLLALDEIYKEPLPELVTAPEHYDGIQIAETQTIKDGTTEN